jgi:hypothetical protein
MFGLTIPFSWYIYAALSLLAVGGIGYGKYQHSQFTQYKMEVESIAKLQEVKVESIKKQQELVTKGIQNEYDAKLALLRQYYSNGVRQPSSNQMLTNGISAKQFDVSSAYSELAGNCAQTTLMLVELQKWVNEQFQIK